VALNDSTCLVVGGGIGGLATALALRHHGAQVTVLEQADALREVGAGLQISPNGLCVLRALGLEDAARAAGLALQSVSLRDENDGREVLALDLTGRADYLALHRADLLGLLGQAARDAGIEMALGQRVTGVIPGAPAQVLLDGAVRKADLVVGADGLHSVLRPVLNGQSAPFFTGQVAWRAVVDNIAGHAPQARVHMGPGRHLVSYPLRGGRLVNLVAVQERKTWADEGWHHRDDPANLRAAFAGACADVRGLLAQVEDPGLWGLFRHNVARVWQADGVALVGDAAHPTLPFLAQGANLALEDAWVLAACLGQGSTLAEYQSLREGRVRKVIAAANGNAWKYHLRPGPVRSLAHLGLRTAGRFAPSRITGQFDWLYGHDVTR